MSAGDRDTLTDEEREALDVATTQYVHGGHIVPDLHTVVERIVAARVRAAQAQAWDEGRKYESNRHADCHMGICVVNSQSVNPYSDATDEFQNPEETTRSNGRIKPPSTRVQSTTWDDHPEPT